MRTFWDYSNVVKDYSKRPQYCPEAVERMLSVVSLKKNNMVCDIGAGTANFTLMLVKRGLKIIAIEPNDLMREQGMSLTRDYSEISWLDAVGEDTGLPAHCCNLVTYASSFNVTDRTKSLIEAHRILAKDGWFACMWNHRDKEDYLQARIEEMLKKYIPDYDDDANGKRYEDQSKIIDSCGLFGQVKKLSARFLYHASKKDFIRMWRSHGTMHPQAKNRFAHVVNDIEKLVNSYEQQESTVSVPYITKIWMAPVKQ